MHDSFCIIIYFVSETKAYLFNFPTFYKVTHLHLSTAWFLSHNFCYLLFLISFSKKYVLIPTAIPLWPLGYSEVCCLISRLLGIFLSLFYGVWSRVKYPTWTWKENYLQLSDVMFDSCQIKLRSQSWELRCLHWPSWAARLRGRQATPIVFCSNPWAIGFIKWLCHEVLEWFVMKQL